jgi:hypothetical protein
MGRAPLATSDRESRTTSLSAPIVWTGLVIALASAFVCGFIHLAYASGRLGGGTQFWRWASVDIGLAAVPLAAGIFAFVLARRSMVGRFAAAALWMGGVACLGLLVAIFGI